MASGPGAQPGQGSEVVLGCEILESDDRPRPTSVTPHRQVRILSVGIVRARDDSCNNAMIGAAGKAVVYQWEARKRCLCVSNSQFSR